MYPKTAIDQSEYEIIDDFVQIISYCFFFFFLFQTNSFSPINWSLMVLDNYGSSDMLLRQFDHLTPNTIGELVDRLMPLQNDPFKVDCEINN